MGPVEEHRERIAQYRTALNGKPGRVAMLRFAYVAETEREAREQTRAIFARYAQYDCGVDWNGQTDNREYHALLQRMNMVIGMPDQVTAQLATWQAEFSLDEIICQTFAAGMQHEDSARSIEKPTTNNAKIASGKNIGLKLRIGYGKGGSMDIARLQGTLEKRLAPQGITVE